MWNERNLCQVETYTVRALHTNILNNSSKKLYIETSKKRTDILQLLHSRLWFKKEKTHFLFILTLQLQLVYAQENIINEWNTGETEKV